jgi:hypothetical protein
LAPDLSPEQRDLLNKVRADWDLADKIHKPWWREAENWIRQYRVYKDWRQAVSSASPRDKLPIIGEGRATWDADLHIPYAFSTVETILAQMLAHRPRMLIEPRDEEALGNVDNMKFLMDAQQERIHYELVLQDIGKDGLILGLGWQKIFWEQDVRERKRLRERKVLSKALPSRSPYAVETVREPKADDWTAVRCEPGDMRWDPYAGRVEDCGFFIHRLWLDEPTIRHRVETGDWTLPEGWTPDDLVGVGKESQAYSETYSARNKISGFTDFNNAERTPYEVWEYHDGERVVTILGRSAVVQIAENPCWGGNYPFQAYRPTTAANGLMPGIGELEPLEHLIREMDTMRTQRRWNVALVLQKVMAYRAGVVDPDDIKIGPGMLIPVNGDPNELLREINFGDIPNSSWREEERLEENINRTSGVSDPITGGGSAGGTATEAQLVRAAASTRIQNKARRIEVEIIQSGGEYAVELNQQKILTNRLIHVPQPPQPYEAERRWAWKAIKPSELMGKMAVKVEGGSTMAENVPQNRQDAMQMANLMRGDPHIQQRKMWEEVIGKFGYEHAEQWLVPEGPQIPPEALQFLQDNGVDPDLIQMALQSAQQQDPTGGQGPAPNEPGDPALEMAQAGP